MLNKTLAILLINKNSNYLRSLLGILQKYVLLLISTQKTTERCKAPVPLVMIKGTYVASLLFLFALAFFVLPLQAEEFRLKLHGEELKKIAAVEIELEFEPKNTFVIDEEFSMHSSFALKETGNGAELCPDNIIEGEDTILFKTVDQNNSVIRVFFAKKPSQDELLFHGSLTRINYSGEAKARIKSVSLIPDFAEMVDSSNISSEIELLKNTISLPFMGISKAELLGPSKRIFSENMFVTIGNIETYGFTLNKSIRKPRINGQEAKFLTDEIIAVNLTLEKQELLNMIDIVLELDVDGQTISKTVDTIKFLSY